MAALHSGAATPAQRLARHIANSYSLPMTQAAAIPRRYGNLVAAIATVACCDIAMGLTLQLLPLLMEGQGIPAWIMGVNAAMGPIGILVAGPLLPHIIGRAGSKQVALGVMQSSSPR